MDTCRVCMIKEKILINMFSDWPLPDSKCSLVEMANDIFEAKISLDDTLSKKVCVSCRLNIQALFIFKRMFKKNQHLMETDGRLESTTPADVKEEQPSPKTECFDNHDSSSTDVNPYLLQRYPICQSKRRIYLESAESDEQMEQPDKENPSNTINTIEGSQSKETRKANRRDENSNKSNTSSKSSRDLSLNSVQVYKCTQCPKSFMKSYTLKRHTYTHTDRVYKCVQCPETFATQFKLNAHTHTHTDERPFKCSQYPKAFTRSDCLKNHDATHTDQR